MSGEIQSAKLNCSVRVNPAVGILEIQVIGAPTQDEDVFLALSILTAFKGFEDYVQQLYDKGEKPLHQIIDELGGSFIKNHEVVITGESGMPPRSGATL